MRERERERERERDSACVKDNINYKLMFILGR